MKKSVFLLSICLVFTTKIFTQSVDLETRLFELADVSFQKIETEIGYAACYELKVKQALDHNNPSLGHFYQKVYLTHKGFDRPTVIVTEGYNRDKNRIYELTNLVEGNQIQVEHRFFGESLPDSLDYQFLDLEQATADLHHIRTLFDDLYTGKWLSTGISKGGSTTIFYRYFYPEDVDVSVPYVAPINRSFEDQRIYKFLDQVGTKECRDKIMDFQISLFESRDEIMPLLKFFNLGADYHYSYFSPEEVFEYTILEYPFSFWQYGHSCESIPDSKSSVEEKVEYLLKVSDVTFFSDETIEYLGPHYYQSAAEMGYYGYETEEFKDHLKFLSSTSNPHATFLPGKMEVDFDGELLKKINSWLKTEENEFIYINGAIDTWSATAVPEVKKDNSIWFFMEGKHHANARIREMNQADKGKLISKLETWLSIDIKEVSPSY